MGSSKTHFTRSEFDGYYAQLQGSALKTTKHAAGLPADLVFHRSVDPDLAKDLETCSNKAVSIINTLLDLASTIGGPKNAHGKGKARLQDEDDFLDRFGTLIVEPMDQLLERAVRSVSRHFVLLSPYPGYCARPILWQDQGTCHRHQPSRAKKEGGFLAPPGPSHTACVPPSKTATQAQAEG